MGATEPTIVLKSNKLEGRIYAAINVNLELILLKSLRGALTLESATGVCRGHDPFFQASRRSLAYQFTINAPLMCPPIFNF